MTNLTNGQLDAGQLDAERLTREMKMASSSLKERASTQAKEINENVLSTSATVTSQAPTVTSQSPAPEKHLRRIPIVIREKLDKDDSTLQTRAQALQDLINLSHDWKQARKRLPSGAVKKKSFLSARSRNISTRTKVKCNKLKWHHTAFKETPLKLRGEVKSTPAFSPPPFALPLAEAYLEQATRDRATEETLRTTLTDRSWEEAANGGDPCLVSATAADESDFPLLSVRSEASTDSGAATDSGNYLQTTNAVLGEYTFTNDYAWSDAYVIEEDRVGSPPSDSSTTVSAVNQSSSAGSSAHEEMDDVEIQLPTHYMDQIPPLHMDQSAPLHRGGQTPQLFTDMDDKIFSNMMESAPMEDLMNEHTLDLILNNFETNDSFSAHSLSSCSYGQATDRSSDPIGHPTDTSSITKAMTQLEPVSNCFFVDGTKSCPCRSGYGCDGYASSDSGINSSEEIASPVMVSPTHSSSYLWKSSDDAQDNQSDFSYLTFPSASSPQSSPFLSSSPPATNYQAEPLLLDMDDQDGIRTCSSSATPSHDTIGSIHEENTDSTTIDNNQTEAGDSLKADDVFVPEGDETRTRKPPNRKRPRPRSVVDKGNKGIFLWEFIRDILVNPQHSPSLIKWEDQSTGLFRFVQSDTVARMWGKKKENPKMTYEKLSRAMRYYYKRGILERVEGRRLVYRFGPNAKGWRKSLPIGKAGESHTASTTRSSVVDGEESMSAPAWAADGSNQLLIPHSNPRVASVRRSTVEEVTTEGQLPSASVLLLRSTRSATA